jgi:hypothetical protein
VNYGSCTSAKESKRLCLEAAKNASMVEIELGHKHKLAQEGIVAAPDADKTTMCLSVPKHMCQSPKDKEGTHCALSLCIVNCNCEAHVFCSKFLCNQTPVADELFIEAKDFCISGKGRIKNTPTRDNGMVMFCAFCHHYMLCNKKNKLALKTKKLGPTAPKKPQKRTMCSGAVIVELWRLCAFHAQVYIFINEEKTNRARKEAHIEEQFCGCASKKTK